ncbi:MAG: aldo/keto reductase [Christensenellaceae bacterium]
MMELCIGTVQFGLQYGIASAGRPSEKDAVDILSYATKNGVVTIDTARAYGDAEQCVGQFVQNVPREQFRIITKIQPNALDGVTDYTSVLKQNIQQSLENLHVSYVDGCLFHNAAYVHNQKALRALHELKSDGFIKKSGISIYTPQEFEAALESPYVDLIQIPYNALDHRLDALLNTKQARKKEIHARSAFLQGLMLMDTVPPHLSAAAPLVQKIAAFCAENHLSRTAFALHYVKTQKSIDKLVFGVDNIMQLKQIIEEFQLNVNSCLIKEFAEQFADTPIEIVNPALWQKNRR